MKSIVIKFVFSVAKVKVLMSLGGDCPRFMSCERSKYGCEDQESIQSSTTPDPGYQWESNKLTVRHHKRKPRGQPFSSW